MYMTFNVQQENGLKIHIFEPKSILQFIFKHNFDLRFPIKNVFNK